MRIFSKANAVLALAAAATLVGCGSQGPAAGETNDTGAESVGSVALSLVLANGASLDSVGYTITGPGGFTKTGSIDVSQSSTVSATISDLPAGSGYSITLSGTSTDGDTSCLGSASFDVTAGASSSVTVDLACHEE